MKYKKKPFTSCQHISLLENRGMIINDHERAKKYLKNIGYYRLSGYMYPLQSKEGKHNFLKGVTFNDVILHYQFDKKLRTLTLEYLERLEIALRARLIDEFSISHGFYWYTNSDLYQDKSTYNTIISDVGSSMDNAQEQFLKKFKNNYTSEILPPANMALEILSFGKLVRLYKGLKNDVEK